MPVAFDDDERCTLPRQRNRRIECLFTQSVCGLGGLPNPNDLKDLDLKDLDLKDLDLKDLDLKDLINQTYNQTQGDIPMELMEYENIEVAQTDTGADTTENEPSTQISGTDENDGDSGDGNTIEIENEPDSEIYESSEIADSSETGTGTTTETETADSPESFEIADSSETETATESATETETGGTLTISDDNPHDGNDTATTADTHIADMIAALNGQLDNDRERMSEEHAELMEQLESINTTATLCVGVLLCILLCTGALFGASLARTFWERFKN